MKIFLASLLVGLATVIICGAITLGCITLVFNLWHVPVDLQPTMSILATGFILIGTFVPMAIAVYHVNIYLMDKWD